MMPTDEERKDALRMLKGATEVAQKYGPMIQDDTEGPRQAITALAIMLASMGVACGVSMHTLMGVVMEVYRKTADVAEDDHEDQ